MYPTEPTTDDILFKFDQVVSTPHLGASTKEAQLRAGTQVAEQVALALKGQFAPNAVNVPLVLGEEADEMMPYLPVCEHARQAARAAHRHGRSRRSRSPTPA